MLDAVLIPDIPIAEENTTAAANMTIHNITSANITERWNATLFKNATFFGNLTLGNLTFGNVSLFSNRSAGSRPAAFNTSLWKDPGYILALAEGRAESYLLDLASGGSGEAGSSGSRAVGSSSSGSSGGDGGSGGGSGPSAGVIIGAAVGVVAGLMLIIAAAFVAVMRDPEALVRAGSRMSSALSGRRYTRVQREVGIDVELPSGGFRV
jgi:hypothetical protein